MIHRIKMVFLLLDRKPKKNLEISWILVPGFPALTHSLSIRYAALCRIPRPGLEGLEGLVAKGRRCHPGRPERGSLIGRSVGKNLSQAGAVSLFQSGLMGQQTDQVSQRCPNSPSVFPNASSNTFSLLFLQLTIKFIIVLKCQ